MFTSTYEISTHHIVLMSWVEFVISTCITSDKLFHYWDFYFFTVVLHSETVRGTKFHKMPIPTKYFNNVRKTCAGSVSLHGLYMVHTSSRWLTLKMPFLAINYLAVGWRCTLISVKIYASFLSVAFQNSSKHICSLMWLDSTTRISHSQAHLVWLQPDSSPTCSHSVSDALPNPLMLS